jgi:hypothetical protein
VDYEIRAMPFGEILDMGFRIVRNHFVLLVGLYAILYVPIGLASQLVVGRNEIPDPLTLLAGLLPIILVWLLLQPILTAAVTHAIAESYLSRTVSLGGALRFSFSIFLPLVGTSILATIIVMTGFLVLIIPGIVLWLTFMLLTPVMVIERIFAFRAMERSWGLAKRNLLRLFGVWIVALVLITVLTGGADLVAGFIPWVGVVLSGIVQGAANAFGTAAFVVVYFDIRCRKEAFDLEHLARQVEAGAGPRPDGAG